MPRADKAQFIQNMLSELEHQQNGSAPSTPEPDSKEWWREVAQELGVKANEAEATTRRLENELAVTAQERDAWMKEWARKGDRADKARAEARRLREALEAARKQIAAIPTREEWLGGQRTAYVQVADVLFILDVALTPTPEGQS